MLMLAGLFILSTECVEKLILVHQGDLCRHQFLRKAPCLNYLPLFADGSYYYNNAVFKFRSVFQYL
jgi:hypothetical protein